MSGVTVQETYRAIDNAGVVYVEDDDLDLVLDRAVGSRGPFIIEMRTRTIIDEGWGPCPET